MGSLGIIATGSAAFALDSGSTVADMGSALPSMILLFVDTLLNGIAGDVVASVAN